MVQHRLKKRLAKLKRIKPLDAKHEKWLAMTIKKVEKMIAEPVPPVPKPKKQALPKSKLPKLKKQAPPKPQLPKQIDWAKVKAAAAKL